VNATHSGISTVRFVPGLNKLLKILMTKTQKIICLMKINARLRCYCVAKAIRVNLLAAQSTPLAHETSWLAGAPHPWTEKNFRQSRIK
jgi:hypothetical protein